MSSSSLQTPHIQRIVTRPTGLELYLVQPASGSPLTLLLAPGNLAHLGGWQYLTTLEELNLSTLGQRITFVENLVAGIHAVCHRKQIKTLLVRLESPWLHDASLPPRDDPAHLLPNGFELQYTYQTLTCPTRQLKKSALNGPPAEELSVSVLAPAMNGHSPWIQSLWLPDWLPDLLKTIFTPDTDEEIANDIPYQMKLLELILAASWQRPSLHLLNRRGEPVGLLLARNVHPGLGELSFVGLVPELRGKPGVAATLLRSAIGSDALAGTRDIMCIVSTRNPRSYAFFAHKWGFQRKTGEHVWKKAIA